MNPQCARCGKVVYPTEKVNCLDKVSKGVPGHPEPAGRQATPALRSFGTWVGNMIGIVCFVGLVKGRGCSKEDPGRCV